MTYKIFKNSIQKDSMSIPRDAGNRDYQQFLDEVLEQGLSIVEGEDVVEPSYVELRQAEYPSMADQMDMQYHDNLNGTTVWADTIQEIKDKYPKTITGGVTITDIPTWLTEAIAEKQEVEVESQEPESTE